MKKVLIINFHELSPNNGDHQNQKTIYTIHEDIFRATIDLIKKNKIPVVSLYDLTNNTIKHDLSIALTFDDGNTSDFSVAYPLLSLLGLPTTFFLPVNKINTYQINWDNAREMADNKIITIGSHGVTHSRMNELSSTKQEYELSYSKEYIEANINKRVDYFALPYGIINPHLVELSKKVGYKGLLTTSVQVNNPELKPYVIHRWSPTSNTTAEMIEKMITFHPVVLHAKIWSSRVKTTSKKILGKHLSAKIHTWYH